MYLTNQNYDSQAIYEIAFGLDSTHSAQLHVPFLEHGPPTYTNALVAIEIEIRMKMEGESLGRKAVLLKQYYNVSTLCVSPTVRYIYIKYLSYFSVSISLTMVKHPSLSHIKFV